VVLRIEYRLLIKKYYDMCSVGEFVAAIKCSALLYLAWVNALVDSSWLHIVVLVF
jgi:hypothetical protein